MLQKYHVADLFLLKDPEKQLITVKFSNKSLFQKFS